jgi:CBS-domain-containing membrane protein
MRARHIHARPIAVDVTTDAEIAIELMEGQRVSCLPVLDAGQLCGVITLHDMRRRGLVAAGEDHCSACGSTVHVRCGPTRTVGLCLECTRKSVPPNLELEIETELGGGA